MRNILKFALMYSSTRKGREEKEGRMERRKGRREGKKEGKRTKERASEQELPFLKCLGSTQVNRQPLLF